jgi:hypothetical protein
LFIIQELKLLTGQRTVPNIFIGGKHLGGFDGERTEKSFTASFVFEVCVGTDTTRAKENGVLKQMLQDVGVEVLVEL